MTTKRDLIWIELMQFDQKVWTVEDVQNRVEAEISENTIRDVLNTAAESGLITHKKNSATWRLQ